ncbi:NAD(P)H-dependent oxidoreductase [Sinomicrobium sp. M5D2P9]
MKTLVIIIHPDPESSAVNKRWKNELEKYPDTYTLHDLYARYPDGKIDVESEQRLLEKFDTIVFQFPFYWFSSPPLFKQWQDDVLSHGWAYGKGSPYKLAGKKMALAISAGINEEDYKSSGRYKYTLAQLTAPLELTFAYIRADYRPLFAFYGTEHNGTPERIEESTLEYMNFLQNL